MLNHCSVCWKVRLVIAVGIGAVNGVTTFSGDCTLAQSIIPDKTLGAESSVVTPDGSVDVISGGATRGANLFHSFEQFSVPPGGTAYFNNALDIQNVISRVTGGSVSSIDGLIRANGTANLFLLNPNGIIFGPNASLDIGGSFVGTTASSLNFLDGTQFSATEPRTTPLLTISVPIGLQFGSNTGGIQVQGTGHSLISPIQSSPVIRDSSLMGLQVQSGKTLAIVGGDVTLQGGILTAEGGRIELGSVDNGLVRLSPTTSGWTLDYDSVSSFKDIRLSQRALVDTSGNGSGSIQLSGRQIVLSDNSAALIKNQGLSPSGNISVNASEFLEMVNIGSAPRFTGGLRTETMGVGSGGDIGVSTKELVIRSGQSISAKTFGVGKGGNITVKATKSVQLIGVSPDNPLLNSNITAPAFGSGQAGNVTVSTRRLTVMDGGGVGSPTFGIARGGDVTVNAIDSVEVIGVAPTFQPSALAASAFNTGNAGNMTVNTLKLMVRDGGRVSSSTFAIGNAGSVTINASDSVEVRGTVPGSVNPSLVVSAAYVLDSSVQRILGVPAVPSGASGDVSINTKRLSVTDGGLVSVRNEGLGNAGKLQINADFINLNNGGIPAATTSGEGGNIFLQSRNLQLKNNSFITTTAGGSSNGGNITINADLVAALGNSDITANAQGGTGGRVTINTQGLFRSPDSDITATGGSPELSGTVEINTLDTDPSRALVTLPTQPVDATGLIAQGCAGVGGSGGSKFVVTGRAGMPDSPNETLNSETPWTDFRPVPYPAENQPGSPFAATQPTDSAAMPLVEATGWTINDKGEVVLTAAVPSATLQVPWLTSNTCHAS